MRASDFEPTLAKISELANDEYTVCAVHMIQSICERPCIPAPPQQQKFHNSTAFDAKLDCSAMRGIRVYHEFQARYLGNIVLVSAVTNCSGNLKKGKGSTSFVT